MKVIIIQLLNITKLFRKYELNVKQLKAELKDRVASKESVHRNLNRSMVAHSFHKEKPNK